ncbi:hypothetical protein CRG98_003645 [Punica granatum]|uniref:Uncharacterized protein n=1 Tax=Punica granatum TaxID=22663 RepID=A0A2I0L5J2_PUNGR|nr:hypothetical protein CRG98_003645 [Punica granatum]
MTPFHACPSRIPGKVDNPKLRNPKVRMRAPTRVHIQVKMDRSYPYLRLDVIVTLAEDITHSWRTFHLVDRSFLRFIIGDLPLLADSPIDWTYSEPLSASGTLSEQYSTFKGQSYLLRLAILLGLHDEEIRHELQHGWAHSIRTAWLVDFIYIRALNATGESYQRDACHGFLLLIFETIMFPYSSNLIDRALAQTDIPHAESSIQGAMRTELQSIREERDRLRCELVDIRAELTDQRELHRELAQTHTHIANQEREIARLSAMLDRTRAKARKVSHP